MTGCWRGHANSANVLLRRRRQDQRFLLDVANQLLFAYEPEECLPLATLLAERDPRDAGAHLMCAWALAELNQPEAALDRLRRARDLLRGGCRLPQLLGEDFIGVLEQGIDAANALRTATQQPAKRETWRVELIAWISVLAGLVPDALDDFESLPDFADLQSSFRTLRELQQAGTLGVEAPK